MLQVKVSACGILKRVKPKIIKINYENRYSKIFQ